MIETRIHSAAVTALISDDEQLSSPGISSGEGSTVSTPEDFAATLQGLIAPNGQTTGQPSNSANAVLVGFTPNNTGTRKAFDTPSSSVPARSANPARSSALSSDLLRVAGIPLPSSPSLQAAKAYTLPTNSYPETPAAVNPASSPVGTTNRDLASSYSSRREQPRTVSDPSASEITLKSIYGDSVLASSEPVRGEVASSSANVPDPSSHRGFVKGATDSADTKFDTINSAEKSTSDLDNQSLAAPISGSLSSEFNNTSSPQNSTSKITIDGRYALSSPTPSVAPTSAQQEHPPSPTKTEVIAFGSEMLDTLPAQSDGSTTLPMASQKSLISSMEGHPRTFGVPAGSTESVQRAPLLQLDRPDVSAVTSAGYLSAKTAIPKDVRLSAIPAISETTYPEAPNPVADPGDRSARLVTPPAITSTSTTGGSDHATSSPNLPPTKASATTPIPPGDINDRRIATNHTTAQAEGRLRPQAQTEPQSTAPYTDGIETPTFIKLATSVTLEGKRGTISPLQYSTGLVPTSDNLSAVTAAAERIAARVEGSPVVVAANASRSLPSQLVKNARSAVESSDPRPLEMEESRPLASANIRLDPAPTKSPSGPTDSTPFIDTLQSPPGVPQEMEANMLLSSATVSFDRTFRNRPTSTATGGQPHPDDLATRALTLSVVPSSAHRTNVSSVGVVPDRPPSTTEILRVSAPMVNVPPNVTQREKVQVTRIPGSAALSKLTASDVSGSHDLTPLGSNQLKALANEQIRITATHLQNHGDQTSSVYSFTRGDSYASERAISFNARDPIAADSVSTDGKAPDSFRTGPIVVNATASQAGRSNLEVRSPTASDSPYGLPTLLPNERFEAPSTYRNSMVSAKDANHSTLNERFTAAASRIDAIPGAIEKVTPQTSAGPDVSHPNSRETNAGASSLPEERPNATSISSATATRASRLLPELLANEAMPFSLQSSAIRAPAQNKVPGPSAFSDAQSMAKPQTPHLGIVSENATGNHGPAVLGRSTESAPIRQTQDVTTQIEAARVAELTVQLADGQTAHAMVRERAGSIDVKIVTSTNASAQRVSSEIDTMRQNLDAAGLRLGQAEVSYQQGGSGRRDGQEQEPRSLQAASKTDRSIFTLSEVAE